MRGKPPDSRNTPPPYRGTGTSRPASELPTSDREFYVLVEEGPPQYRGVQFVIARNPTVIGRSEGADIQFEVPSLSRRHAAIAFSPEGFWTVTDLKSLNGVMLNGRRIDAARIGPEDRLSFGEDITVTFQARSAEWGTTAVRPAEPEPSLGPPETRALVLRCRRASADDAILVADVVGRVDGYNYVELKDQLNAAVEAGERLLIVNLAQVSFMDHTGLGALVSVRANLDRLGGSLRVAAATRRLTEGISLLRLEPLLQPCATEADAVDQLRPLAAKGVRPSRRRLPGGPRP